MTYRQIFSLIFLIVPIAIFEYVWFSPFMQSQLPAWMFFVWSEPCPACANLLGGLIMRSMHTDIAFWVPAGWFILCSILRTFTSFFHFFPNTQIFSSRDE
jgi:ABC-type uncharacterized transport system permease subunit